MSAWGARGRVYDLLSGEPLEGARVRIQKTFHVTNTSPQGSFFFNDEVLAKGVYRLEVSKEGYQTEYLNLYVPGGKILAVGLSPEEVSLDVKVTTFSHRPRIRKNTRAPLNLFIQNATKYKTGWQSERLIADELSGAAYAPTTGGREFSVNGHQSNHTLFLLNGYRLGGEYIQENVVEWVHSSFIVGVESVGVGATPRYGTGGEGGVLNLLSNRAHVTKRTLSLGGQAAIPRVDNRYSDNHFALNLASAITPRLLLGVKVATHGDVALAKDTLQRVGISDAYVYANPHLTYLFKKQWTFYLRGNYWLKRADMWNKSLNQNMMYLYDVGGSWQNLFRERVTFNWREVFLNRERREQNDSAWQPVHASRFSIFQTEASTRRFFRHEISLAFSWRKEQLSRASYLTEKKEANVFSLYLSEEYSLSNIIFRGGVSGTYSTDGSRLIPSAHFLTLLGGRTIRVYGGVAYNNSLASFREKYSRDTLSLKSETLSRSKMTVRGDSLLGESSSLSAEAGVAWYDQKWRFSARLWSQLFLQTPVLKQNGQSGDYAYQLASGETLLGGVQVEGAWKLSSGLLVSATFTQLFDNGAGAFRVRPFFLWDREAKGKVRYTFNEKRASPLTFLLEGLWRDNAFLSLHPIDPTQEKVPLKDFLVGNFFISYEWLRRYHFRAGVHNFLDYRLFPVNVGGLYLNEIGRTYSVAFTIRW